MGACGDLAWMTKAWVDSATHSVLGMDSKGDFDW